VARRRRARDLLLRASVDFDLGHHRAQVDTTDRPARVERKHGRHRVHHQFGTPALREYAFAPGRATAAALATAGAGCAGAVLWNVFDNVGVGPDKALAMKRRGAVAIRGGGGYSDDQLDGW